MLNKSISRKSFLTGSAAIVAGLGLSACSGESSDSSDSSSSSTTYGSGENGTVYWLNFKPEIDETVQSLGKQYAKSHDGIAVKIVTAASGDYQQTLTSEMDKSEAPTIFVIGNSEGVKTWGDYAMDLTDSDIANEQTTDIYNQYDGDKLVSVAYCYECYGIVVNVDLVEKAGHSMDEITNFDGLKTVVEDIHNNADANGFDAFAAPDMDDANSWRITGHLANLEYYYEERDDGGWDECPSEIKGTYMDNFKNLYDLIINNATVDPTQLATGGHDPQTEFTDQKAAFYLTGSWDYATISESCPNTTMIPYYCGVEGEEKAGLCCGTENCWAINDSSSDDDKTASMDFLVWLVTDEDASKDLVEQLGIMPFKSAAESTNGWLEQAQADEDAGDYVMDWATNYQPNVDDYRAALVSALNDYDSDQSDENWDKVVTAFVDGWATQYEKANG